MRFDALRSIESVSSCTSLRARLEGTQQLAFFLFKRTTHICIDMMAKGMVDKEDRALCVVFLSPRPTHGYLGMMETGDRDSDIPQDYNCFSPKLLYTIATLMNGRMNLLPG